MAEKKEGKKKLKKVTEDRKREKERKKWYCYISSI